MLKDAPLSADAFTQHVADQIAQMPEVAIREIKDLLLEIEYRGSPQSIGLDNRYRQYLRAPDRLADIVESVRRAVTLTSDSLPEVNRATVEHLVMPQIKPLGFVESAKSTGAPELLTLPFPGDLAIAFVLDMPESMMFVNVEHAASAGLKAEQVLGYALRNLKARTPDRAAQVHGSGRNTLCVCATLDGYDAARILLSELMDKWAKRVKGRLLLGIPNRDFLIGLGDEDRGLVGRVAAQLRADFRSRDYAISPLVFEWKDGQARPRVAGPIH